MSFHVIYDSLANTFGYHLTWISYGQIYMKELWGTGQASTTNPCINVSLAPRGWPIHFGCVVKMDRIFICSYF